MRWRSLTTDGTWCVWEWRRGSAVLVAAGLSGAEALRLVQRRE